MIDNLHPIAAKSKKSWVFALFFFMLFYVAFFTFCGVVKASSADEAQESERRAVKALQAIEKNQWDQARDLIIETKDPLASKIYYWLVFTRQKGPDNFASQQTQFIRKNPHWPSITNLRLQVENNMPRTTPPPGIVAWFDDYPPLTEAAMDRYLGALIAQGKTQSARKTLSNWWASTPLKREQQKNIFRKYAYLLNIDDHQRRLDMLLREEQYENAIAIAHVLNRGYPDLARARIALARQEKSVEKLLLKVPEKLQTDSGLIYERLRWYRRNELNDRAILILNNMPRFGDEDSKTVWWRERHIMIRRMLEQRKYGAAYTLAQGHIQNEGLAYAQAEWLSGWLSLRFLKEAPRAAVHFEALYSNVKTPLSKARAAYWAGRAYDDMGDKTRSDEWYDKAAQFQTTYYGQHAGAQMGEHYELSRVAPPALQSSDIDIFEKNELLRAARLFHRAGLHKESGQFLHAFTFAENTPKAYRYAAEQAAKMGYNHDALRIAKRATKEGMFLTAQSYPVINNQLKNVKIERALVHAIIRQESLFDANARSHAGALGLMQLMPATAKQTAKEIGVPYNLSWLTSRPDYNIHIGSGYLAEMLTRFGGAYPLAIAAYNAGPNRVDRWLKSYGDPRLGEISWIDWIEAIPIYETRNYVQRVMESTNIYRLRLGSASEKIKRPSAALSYR